jgi:hypothetical protein
MSILAPPQNNNIQQTRFGHSRWRPSLLILVLVNAGAGPESTAKNLPFWVGAVVYIVLIVECAIVQSGLFTAGVGKHRGWQVIVGGAILNPCVLGWWIPVSVLLAVRRAR